MQFKKRSFLAIFFSILSIIAFSQNRNATIYGVVTDPDGNPLEMVNVSLKDFPLGTSTNQKGEFLFRIPAGDVVEVVFTIIGYTMLEKQFQLNQEERREINVTLIPKNEKIDEITITDRKQSTGNMIRVDPKVLEAYTDVGMGGVEGIIKTFAGVNSNNELSTQYSVRGGSFDENLVYVNDIEIYRPFLIRAGQQEGLSFINSDMVSSIAFSAGGFDAQYGDKMSSVLNISYRKPDQFRASASASLLGGTFHIADRSKNGKFTYSTGLRYKSYRYLFGTLDEKGEYNPVFIDFQAYITQSLGENWELALLSNISYNQYQFVPETRETKFGTFFEPIQAKIYFDGQEKDLYKTYTGALSLNYSPSRNFFLKFIASAYSSNEQEKFDIQGQYYLNQVGRDSQKETFGDSVLNLGIGTFLEHGRNYLEARVYSFAHKGQYRVAGHDLKWGLTYKREYISDKMREWEYRDSTGYSMPYSDERVLLYHFMQTNHQQTTNRFSGYLQETFTLPLQNSELLISAGARLHYWDYMGELNFSPRVSATWIPNWESNMSFRLSTGKYVQPPFYKELKNASGTVATNVQTPKSYHFVAGMDYSFSAWNRPFKFTGEVYYKYLNDLIPYQVDNVRVRYLSDLVSDGYARGIDLKINGEIVSGTQSWASISFLRTSEDLAGDDYGYIPRPNDQRFKFSLYFQDYLPGNPS